MDASSAHTHTLPNILATNHLFKAHVKLIICLTTTTSNLYVPLPPHRTKLHVFVVRTTFLGHYY